MEFDDIRLQEELSDKQLTIFNAEMQRQHRSIGVGYVLLIFLGAFGVHKFYLGRAFAGIVYALLFLLGWALTGGAGAAVFLGTADDAIGGMVLTGLFLLAILGFALIWDLITLPSQIRSREKKLRRELLRRLVEGANPAASQTVAAK